MFFKTTTAKLILDCTRGSAPSPCVDISLVTSFLSEIILLKIRQNYCLHLSGKSLLLVQICFVLIVLKKTGLFAIAKLNAD